MTITLKPEQEAFVRQQLKSGKYRTIDDVIVKAFQLLAERDREYLHGVEETRAQVEVEQLTQEKNKQVMRFDETIRELKRTQAQLIQTEKMSRLGQIVADIANEINGPLGFIYGNINSTVREYIQDLIDLINIYQEEYPNPTARIQSEIEEIDLELIVEDLSKLLDSIHAGADRIRYIVRSLRTFSHLDKSFMTRDIHEGIESTLVMLERRLGSASIQVIKAFSQLPLVTCYASELNQVFLHILNNAIDALHNQPSPQIIIRTEMTRSDRVKIAIADNGPGMSEEVKERIFDPFFTTKPAGAGTGLGLSICYSIVVEQHRGSLTCNSALGQGTELIIEIPILPKT
ncbi:MAG: sensor histidine kinase [Hormoscilla sp.]